MQVSLQRKLPVTLSATSSDLVELGENRPIHPANFHRMQFNQITTIDNNDNCSGEKADAKQNHKKLSYRRGTARCVVSIEILPIATQQSRNYLYDKS